MGGAEGLYTHPEPNKENLIVYGPITEDITLYVSENSIVVLSIVMQESNFVTERM